jgi:hypothetical protein
MPSKTFNTVLIMDDETSGCMIELPFDPKEVFGKVRVPVKVTINGFTYRTTIFSMGGCFMVPFSKINRDGAGIKPSDKIKVLMELDTEQRVVVLPDDLAAVLKKNKNAAAVWEKLSYTHKREYVDAIEKAKRPETRARRLAWTMEALEGKRSIDT